MRPILILTLNIYSISRIRGLKLVLLGGLAGPHLAATGTLLKFLATGLCGVQRTDARDLLRVREPRALVAKHLVVLLARVPHKA